MLLPPDILLCRHSWHPEFLRLDRLKNRKNFLRYLCLHLDYLTRPGHCRRSDRFLFPHLAVPAQVCCLAIPHLGCRHLAHARGHHKLAFTIHLRSVSRLTSNPSWAKCSAASVGPKSA
jgi:hypothetical protein